MQKKTPDEALGDSPQFPPYLRSNCLLQKNILNFDLSSLCLQFTHKCSVAVELPWRYLLGKAHSSEVKFMYCPGSWKSKYIYQTARCKEVVSIGHCLCVCVFYFLIAPPLVSACFWLSWCGSCTQLVTRSRDNKSNVTLAVFKLVTV